MKLKKNSLLLAITFASFTTLSIKTAPTIEETIRNKNILVLGGTGYLGQAIVEAVSAYAPKKIVIFSRDEVKHFKLSTSLGKNIPLTHIVGDIRDYKALEKATKGIDIVFHAAALKRMDMLEYNVEESVKTNINGAANVFLACTKNNVDKVVFISTDKACLPINTYGASKFVAEKIFTNYDKNIIKTKFMAVRFGNIIESTGSVIPIFNEKIKSGQDIPLTSPEMTRFIINKKEAAELILDALLYGTGGEIFVRKIAAMKIIDLIEVLKEAHGKDNTVKVIGIRPGEKMNETLISEFEMARAYEFENKYVILPSIADASLNTDNIPVYIELGTSLAKNAHDFSSNQAVISKNKLAKYLQAFWQN